MVNAARRDIDDAVSRSQTGLPKVGTISAWFDPEDPGVWSGVPLGLVGELRRLGVYAGNRYATPFPAVARVVHRWMRLTGRSDGWARRAEMRAITPLSDLVLRLTTPEDVDGWIHLPGANGPVVRGRYVTFHDTSPAQLVGAGPELAASLGFPRATRSQLDWVARKQVGLYRKAHAVCVPSRWVADSMVRDHGIDARAIRIVGMGRNADIIAPEHRDWSTPRFLFIGRDWKRKNGDAVIRCFSRVRNEVPEARLDVVGRHPPLDVDGVTDHGFITVNEPDGRRRIEELFRAATCLVVPSFVEPFGIVYLEAGGAGLPCVATANGGMPTSVGDGGILVHPNDDEAIYKAMRRLCDPEEARRMGAVALSRAPLFTWSAFGQRILRSLDLGPIPGVTLAEYL